MFKLSAKFHKVLLNLCLSKLMIRSESGEMSSLMKQSGHPTFRETVAFDPRKTLMSKEITVERGEAKKRVNAGK